MTNIIGIEQNLGDAVFEPHVIPSGHYNQAAILYPGGMTKNLVVWSNGTIKKIAAERGAPTVGEFKSMVAMIFSRSKSRNLREDRDESDFDKVKRLLLDPTMEDLESMYSNRFDLMSASSKNSEPRKQAPVDVRVLTRPIVPRDKYIMYERKDFMHIEVDNAYQKRQDDLLQELITERINTIRALPDRIPIGIGMLNKGWTELYRPNRFVKVGSRTVLEVKPKNYEWEKQSWTQTACYIYLLAEYQQRWLGENPFKAKGWTYEDNVAFITDLVGRLGGVGSTEFKIKPMDTKDIEKMLSHFPGIAWSQSNRWMFGGNGNKESYEDIRAYWIWCRLLGIVVNRVKAGFMDFNLNKRIYVQEGTVVNRLDSVLKPNLENWGSNSDMYYIMRRNTFNYKDTVDTGVICLVDMNALRGASDAQILDEANCYEELETKEATSWSPVRIEKGELPMGVADEKMQQTKFIVLSATNDSRIYERSMTDGLNSRSIVGLKLPLHDIIENSLSEENRKAMWLYGLQGNCDTRGKDGFIADAGMGVIEPVSVKYRRGSLNSTVVEKDGTRDPKGMKSELIPGGQVAAVSVNVETEPLNSTVEPPPSKPRSPDRPELVEVDDKGNTSADSSIASPEVNKEQKGEMSGSTT